MCLSLLIQVQDLGPISHLEAKAPSEWSILALWYPMAPRSTGGCLGEGKRPGEWIKGVGEDVALDGFNGGSGGGSGPVLGGIVLGPCLSLPSSNLNTPPALEARGGGLVSCTA